MNYNNEEMEQVNLNLNNILCGLQMTCLNKESKVALV